MYHRCLLHWCDPNVPYYFKTAHNYVGPRWLWFANRKGKHTDTVFFYWSCKSVTLFWTKYMWVHWNFLTEERFLIFIWHESYKSNAFKCNRPWVNKDPPPKDHAQQCQKLLDAQRISYTRIYWKRKTCYSAFWLYVAATNMPCLRGEMKRSWLGFLAITEVNISLHSVLS